MFFYKFVLIDFMIMSKDLSSVVLRESLNTTNFCHKNSRTKLTNIEKAVTAIPGTPDFSIAAPQSVELGVNGT